MRGASWLRRWLRLSKDERRRTREAAGLLTVAWLAVRLLPFGWYACVLGRPANAGPPPSGHPDAEMIARDVGRAMRRAAAHLPWRSTCLMRAFAGKAMLRRRQCPALVYLGASRRRNVGMAFHAWVRVGTVSVSGGQTAPRCTVVATFR